MDEGEEPWGAFGEGEERPDQPEGEDRADENQPPEDTEGSRACGELKADMRLCHHCISLFSLQSFYCFSQPRRGLVYDRASWVFTRALRWFEWGGFVGGMKFNILTDSLGLFTFVTFAHLILLFKVFLW